MLLLSSWPLAHRNRATIHSSSPSNFNTRKDPAPQEEQVFKEPGGAPGLPCYVTAESVCLVFDLGGFHVLKELLLAGH